MSKDEHWRDALSVFRETVLKGRDVIYVVGYPRSGTTWLTRLLAQCLDSPALSWSINNDVRDAEHRDPAVEGLHRRGPYIVRHGHSKPKGRDPGSERILHIFRNPLDVAVSCWRYFGFRHGGTKGLYDCVDQLCGKKGVGLGFVNVNGRGWAGYVKGWLGLPGLIWIRYEDLLADTEGTITDVIKRLGLGYQPPVRIRKAVKDHTFANRKPDKTMRKGVVGSWKKELPAELVKKICNHCHAEMGLLDYEVKLPQIVESKPRKVSKQSRAIPSPRLNTEPIQIVRIDEKPRKPRSHSLLGRRQSRR